MKSKEMMNKFLLLILLSSCSLHNKQKDEIKDLGNEILDEMIDEVYEEVYNGWRNKKSKKIDG